MSSSSRYDVPDDQKQARIKVFGANQNQHHITQSAKDMHNNTLKKMDAFCAFY